MDTFVLRIWTPAPVAGDTGAAPQGTHGTAHHVVSGRSGVFRSEDQLLRLLVELQKEAAADGPAGGPETAGRPTTV
ncbi:MAG TPA: hypothetical protein VFO05_06315 [Candidatus Limnocylindrales bacterium]|nr:hypothetical protein [Candidatus Limnocylindrales bacterium]